MIFHIVKDEEIGLFKEDVEILGPIDDSLTFVPPFIVHPFVGLIPHPYPFNINPREVEKTIEVPLKFFASQVSEYDPTSAGFEQGRGYPEYRYGGELIWGTTASIVANFLCILRAHSKITFLHLSFKPSSAAAQSRNPRNGSLFLWVHSIAATESDINLSAIMLTYFE